MLKDIYDIYGLLHLLIFFLFNTEETEVLLFPMLCMCVVVIEM